MKATGLMHIVAILAGTFICSSCISIVATVPDKGLPILVGPPRAVSATGASHSLPASKGARRSFSWRVRSRESQTSCIVGDAQAGGGVKTRSDFDRKVVQDELANPRRVFNVRTIAFSSHYDLIFLLVIIIAEEESAVIMSGHSIQKQ